MKILLKQNRNKKCNSSLHFFKTIIIILSSIFLLFNNQALADGFSNKENVSINDFITGSNGTIVYRLFVPKNYNPSISYPLVVYLHGAGERGNNNSSQMTEWPMLFAQDSNQVRWSSFILAPQCPSNQQWVNTPWSNGSYSIDNIQISTALSDVNNTINQLISSYSIDVNRLYVTGLSMGGYGSWDFISRFPNKFAAAIPICGGGDPTKAPDIKHIPLRFYHSSDDVTVPVSGSREMNNALLAANANDAVYKEYTNLNHISWPTAYKEKGLLLWMYSQNKSQSNSGKKDPTPINSLQDGDKVLFIGNSYTDWSGPLPNAIKSIIKASGSNLNVHFQFMGKGMGILKEYATWNSLHIVDTIRKGGWKYVVIQGWNDAFDIKNNCTLENGNPNPLPCIGFPANRDTMLKYLRVLDSEIRKIGAKTILFEPQASTWDYPTFRPVVKQTYSILKDSVSVFYAPIVNSWDTVRAYYPPISYACPNGSYNGFISMLYADCGHQNPNGVALNAMTFYTILTGRSAFGLNPEFPSKMTKPEFYNEFANIAYRTGKSIRELNNCAIIDNQAPTPPSNLTVTQKMADSFRLNWTASSDDIGVLGYKIFVNNILFDTTAFSHYNFGYLTPSTDYSVKISAFDSEGKESSVVTIEVATPETEFVDFTGQIVSWNFTGNNGASFSISNDVASGISRSDPSVIVRGAVYLTASNFDNNAIGFAGFGNETLAGAIQDNRYISFSLKPQVGNYLIIDSICFEPFSQNNVHNFSLFSSINGFNQSNAIGSFNSNSTIMVNGHDSLVNTVEFRLYVWGSSNGWLSAGLNDLKCYGSVKSSEYPLFPTGLSTTNLTETGFTLHWKPAKDAVSYEVFKNNVSLGTTNSLLMNISGVAINSTYSMTVRSMDASSNFSEESSILFVKIPDKTSPTIPQNLWVTGLGESSFVLNWNPSTDNVGVTRYEVFMNGLPAGNTSETNMPEPFLEPLETYIMTVRAVDAAGNISALSEPLNVTTLQSSDTEAPTAPTNLVSTNLTNNSFRVSWSESSDNVGVKNYMVYINEEFYETTTATTIAFSGLTPNTNYSITIKATDVGKNVSVASDPLQVTTLLNPVLGSIASWNFFGQAPNSNPVSISTNNLASGISTVVPSGVATIADGLTPSTDYFGNGLTAYSNHAFSLAEAISLNEYISFSIAPENNKTITVNSINIRPISQNRERILTVFSNITGFDIEDSLGSFTSNSNVYDMIKTVSITNIEKVSTLIEFRVYFHSLTQNSWEGVGIGNGNDNTPDILIEGIIEDKIIDTQAPSAPSGLATLNISNNSFNLAWNPSSDNEGVDSYDVFIDGILFTTVNDTFIHVSDLNPSQTYSVVIKAKDEAGNISEASSPYIVNTLVSILGYSDSEVISIYPNPIEYGSVIKIEGLLNQELTHFKILDLSGKALKNEFDFAFQGIYFLNIAELRNGVYLIQISNNRQNRCFKVFVNK